MIRILFIISALFATASASIAQEMKSWGSGPLVWNDFQGTPVLTNGPAYLAADIVLVSGEATSEAKQIQCQAVMYPSESYASDTERTPERLRYFQTQFNLAELIALRLQEEMNGGLSEKEAAQRLDYYRSLYKEESKRLAQDTNNGTDLVRLQADENNILGRIEDMLEPSSDDLKASPFRYGLFAGTGFVATTGKLADYFNTAWDFSFGLIFDWKRFGLEASITFAYPTLQDSYLVQDKYAQMDYYANVKNANYVAAGFNGGFNVVDTKKFLIRPYVGGMWTSYSWTARPLDKSDMSGNIIFDGPQQRMSLSDFNVIFGINLEWHFHRALTSWQFFGGSHEEYISSLRLTPYAIHSVYKHAYPQSFGGWQIGLTVAYSGVGRAMGIK